MQPVGLFFQLRCADRHSHRPCSGILLLFMSPGLIISPPDCMFYKVLLFILNYLFRCLVINAFFGIELTISYLTDCPLDVFQPHVLHDILL